MEVIDLMIAATLSIPAILGVLLITLTKAFGWSSRQVATFFRVVRVDEADQPRDWYSRVYISITPAVLSRESDGWVMFVGISLIASSVVFGLVFFTWIR